jgi:hypothetical protein
MGGNLSIQLGAGPELQAREEVGYINYLFRLLG